MPAMKSLLLAAAAAALAAPAAARPEAAPRVSAASIDQLPQPLPLPYDAAADAHRAVDQARAEARRTGKRLLIDMGGNWCLDCRVLAGILQLPELRPFVARHFVVVAVDIGRYDKNLDIADRFAAHYDRGAPAVLVVDPRSGKLLNPGRTLALTDARHLTPQALADWLAQWT
jgi:thiol:disulfide interchange protein